MEHWEYAVPRWLKHSTHYKGRGFDFRRGSLGFFNDFNPSGRNMPLGSIQPLTEMSTSDVTGGGGWGGGKAASA